MGPKKEVLSLDAFLEVRALEDKKIVAENELLMQQLKARIDYQKNKLLQDGDGGLEYPMDLHDFNSVHARKKESEFINKGRFLYNCSLNAFNNALPSGKVVTVNVFNLLRDMKVYHLAKGNMVLYLEGVNQQVILSLFLSLFLSSFFPFEKYKTPTRFKVDYQKVLLPINKKHEGRKIKRTKE